MKCCAYCCGVTLVLYLLIIIIVTIISAASGDSAGAITAFTIMIVVWLVIFAFAFLILYNSIYIIQQAESMVIERFGAFNKILNSGLNWIVPFVDQPRQITWRYTHLDQAGQLQDETRTITRVDLRESVFNFMRQEVYTKDTVLLDVNSVMFFRIFDIKKAIYEVEDLQSALSNTAQTQLKEVFGEMTFTEALNSQQKINQNLIQNFAKLFSGWGITVERMELLDFTPKAAITEAMKKQMIAERQRRGEFIISEGNKAAMRLNAEGSRRVKVIMGLAEQESTRKISEGEAGAKVALATAERTALETISASIKVDGVLQSDYMIAQRYNELFRSVSNSESKTIYLPYEIKALGGMVSKCSGFYGMEGPRSSSKPPPRGKAPADSFSDLN